MNEQELKEDKLRYDASQDAMEENCCMCNTPTAHKINTSDDIKGTSYKVPCCEECEQDLKESIDYEELKADMQEAYDDDLVDGYLDRNHDYLHKHGDLTEWQ